MSIEKKEIEKLASLARIELTSKEKEKFGKQLSSILDYVDQIQEVDTSSVKEIAHHSVLKNVFRQDKVKGDGNIEKNLSQFPDRFGNLNKVKPVLGNNEHEH